MLIIIKKYIISTIRSNGTKLPKPDPKPPADCANAGEIIIYNPFRFRNKFKRNSLSFIVSFLSFEYIQSQKKLCNEIYKVFEILNEKMKKKPATSKVIVFFVIRL